MALVDVDTGSQVTTTVGAAHGMVTITFGSSFTLHLDAAQAAGLGAVLSMAGAEVMRGKGGGDGATE